MVFQATNHQIERCVIIANGTPPTAELAHRYVDQSDLLLAADGGARYALALDLIPDVVIGDLDSLPQPQCEQLEAAGARLIIHPPAKDETDLELALLYAAEQEVRSIIVLGALGGRVDQMLANILLLTLPALRERDVRLVDQRQTLFLIHPESRLLRSFPQDTSSGDGVMLSGTPGDTVSLIPLSGPACGVTTQGLLFPLEGNTLPFGPALGISNELTETRAHVRVQDGLLLCVHFHGHAE